MGYNPNLHYTKTLNRDIALYEINKQLACVDRETQYHLYCQLAFKAQEIKHTW